MSVAGWVWFYAALNAGLTAAVSAILLTTAVARIREVGSRRYSPVSQKRLA